ncbi:S41 family peptidase [bacterium]|nr:S41 family peptidase [bacterium]
MGPFKKYLLLVVPLLWKVFLIVFCATMFGAFAGDTKVEKPETAFEQQWKELITIYNALEEYTPADLDPKEIFYGGIRGMLATLDPHTHFLDDDAFSYMREEQEGSFFGIGISFDISPDGYLRVVAPIDGTPAQLLGIRAGDRIVKIDGESTKNITEVEVIRKLRGQKGSKVVITIQRESQPELKDITIVRDRIPLLTVREPYLIRPDIGYIKVTQFSKPTKEELIKALEILKEQGMKKLVLDLRNNPGGLLDQAVEVSDIFIDKGNKIVMTDGRIPSSHFEFVATTPDTYKDLPIIILVNSNSASASEIVAGALQDLDRALIVGERTYGKGLVQRQYPLEPRSLGTALQITTAKYFTPSQRCIQKSYKTQHDLLAFHVEKTHTPLDEERDQVFFSRGGRKLEGGGGIVPDIVLEQTFPDILLKLLIKDMFFSFAINFASQHQSIERDFEVSDQLFDEFRAFAEQGGVEEITEQDWLKDKEQVRIWIKQEIISAFFGLDAKLRVANEHDTQLVEALKLFDQAQELLETYRAAMPTEQQP